jgi:hypothetical protein
MPGDTWVEALQKSGLIDAAPSIDNHKFNTAFAESGSVAFMMLMFAGSDQTMVPHVRHQHQQHYFLMKKNGRYHVQVL